MAVKNKIFIPTLISSVNYQPVRTLPHIYFYNGLKDCEEYYIQHYESGSTSVVTSSVQEQFPYLDYYDGLTPTTGSNSLLFFNEGTPYGVVPTGSLYTQYWDKYVSLLYDPRTRLINASGIIPLADYFEMELNDIVQWRGNYYHLRAINDYNLKDGTCKLQLLGPIIRDSILGQPFDCSFNFSSSIEPLIASGGLETTWISGSYLWKSHIFENPGTGSFVVQSGATNSAKILLVGAGGQRGSEDQVGSPAIGRTPGGGGGGGVLQYNDQTLLSGSYTVIVPFGQPEPVFRTRLTGLNGSGSFFSGSNINYSVLGGGGGGFAVSGPTQITSNGSTGGSGGGAGGTNTSPGSGTAGQGFAGSAGWTNGTNTFGGSGGGAGEAGNSGGILGYGGNGKQSTLYYGVNAFYGGGGTGRSDQDNAGLNGLPGFGQYGLGGGLYNGFSNPGIVIISYPFKEINENITQLVRFTPTISSGTLEYVEGGTGLLKQQTFTTSASIDLCVVSGSQWNIFTSQKGEFIPLELQTSIPTASNGGTRTILSTNCI
jgi:hypothetical protein